MFGNRSALAVDPQQRLRVYDDLRGLLRGELLFDDLSRALYSTDASIFQVEPLGVVVPRDEEDVRTLVEYAAEQRLPLIPRGAGSGLAGESLGRGLIVDLSHHFRGIEMAGSEMVRAQVGVTCQELNAFLAPQGRRFAPDPISAAQCTLGGMLATNASGVRVLRHGPMREHVLSLRLVLDNGDAVWAGREPLAGAAPTTPSHWQDIVATLAMLLEQHADLLSQHRPGIFLDRCGYSLAGVLRAGELDLVRLLVGSEGTLAMFTAATLRTLPLPGGRAGWLLAFPSLEAALQVAEQVLATAPAACELLERRLLGLARGHQPAEVGARIPAAAEAILLVEYEADSQQEAEAVAADLGRRLLTGVSLVQAQLAASPAELESCWQLYEAVRHSLHALRDGPRPLPFVEDAAVPLPELPRFLHAVQQYLQEAETTAAFLIHPGTGQVQVYPLLDLQNPRDVARLSLLAERIHSRALELGGTVSSQHGLGLARTSWVARQCGPLYSLFRQVKAIFDPHGIFNPGKIVDPDPLLPLWPLRRLAAGVEAPPLLHWPAGALAAEVNRCNGCAQCRAVVPPLRMCPLFRARREEAASPRAKANLLRQLWTGALPLPLSAEAVRAVADLCVNCRMCAQECPAQVNIPKLMLEAKAANVAEHGLDWHDWFFAHLEELVAWASSWAGLANFALRSNSIRWILEKLFGLSARRRLPPLASRPFLESARRRGWCRPLHLQTRTGDLPPIAFFVDTFANYYDPSLAEAGVAVLRHQRLDVYVPAGQRGCGMTALALGDLDTCRERARHHLRLLADLARAGYLIVCAEPTAALMFRHDYPDLVDDAEARLLAERTVELTAFLADLHVQGRLRTDFQPLPLHLGYHIPCHLKALGRPPATPVLLRLIPGMQLTILDLSCSGMAGTFGLRAAHYADSLAAGQPMLQALAQPHIQFGVTECSACRLQMEDVTGKRTLHPVQYLALAYGLLPEIRRRLEEPLL